MNVFLVGNEQLLLKFCLQGPVLPPPPSLDRSVVYGDGSGRVIYITNLYNAANKQDSIGGGGLRRDDKRHSRGLGQPPPQL